MHRGVRKGLTPATILEEAFAMVDAGGVAALTMRGLARRMNVAAMAIYNHYEDRDAILDALAERVFAELPKKTKVQRSWKDQLRSILLNAHKLGSNHPHIYRLAMTRPNKPASAFQLTTEAMAALQDAGLNEAQATTVYHTFVILLHGFPFWRETFELQPEDCMPASGTTGNRARAKQRASPAVLADRQFAASVEWLLDSVDNLST